MNTKIFFNEPYISGKEKLYIEDVFSRNQFYGNGFYTDKCHRKIAEILGVNNVLLTDSCTSALEISALLIRDWTKEQEVILPSYTFSSTASAFARAGFKLIFAEVDPANMMIDLQDVANKITDKTVAVIVVHYGGWAVDLKSFRRFCIQNSLFLVEDAAQAFGCVDHGVSVGTVGDFGCFSFHETKNIHAGLSGCLVVNNNEFVTRAMHVWERGTNRQEVLKGMVDKYSWVEIGGSFYPTEIQAAFLLAQLESLDENVKARKLVFEGYYDVFNSECIDAVYYPRLKEGFQTNYHAFWIMLSSIEECDYVRSGLQRQGINAYIGYVPLHSSKVGRSLGNRSEDLPLTEEFAQRLLRLPFHNNMSNDVVVVVARNTVNLIKEYRV